MKKEKQDIKADYNNLYHPLVIGDKSISNNIFLAPMAGGSEMSYRIICRNFGAGFSFTELSTARGMRYQKSVERNYKYLEISKEEIPVAIQLFGFDPIDFEYAIDMIFNHEVLSQCSVIDINMGCPVPKVTKNGAGSALMKNPSLASDIIKACKKVSPVPVSCKIRSGWNKEQINAVEFAKRCEDSGIDMITVHARTANQMYSGKANWDIISDVKSNLKIPVVGNGDIVCENTAKEMLVKTGVDAIMIGRAALGNPWIFKRVKHFLENDSMEGYQEPGIEEKVLVMKEHLIRAIDQFGEETAVKEMRKHFAWYLKGVPHSNKIKNELMVCKSKAEISSLLETLLDLFL